MALKLETTRFFLRPVGAHDLHYYLDLDSDPEVMKYLNGGRASTVEEAQGGIERTLKIFETNQGKFGLWLVFAKSDMGFAGWVLFRPCKKDPANQDFIELGYRLKRAYWGQGVATELSRHMLDYGFNDLQVREVFADTLVDNLGSQGVMKKIGMSFVKEFDHDEIIGTTNRCVRYSLQNPRR